MIDPIEAMERTRKRVRGLSKGVFSEDGLCCALGLLAADMVFDEHPDAQPGTLGFDQIVNREAHEINDMRERYGLTMDQQTEIIAIFDAAETPEWGYDNVISYLQRLKEEAND